MKHLLILLVLLLVVVPVLAQGDGGIDPALQAELDRAEAQVAEMRDLSPARNITRRLVTEEELVALVDSQITADYTAEDAADDALFYASLGFMPIDTDLVALNKALLAEQVAGFYDTETDTMYVLTNDPTRLDPFAELIYAHEYTHALQDANFNLDNLVDDELFTTNPDMALAGLALAEGDAQLMTLLYAEWFVVTYPEKAMELISQMGDVESGELDSAPEIIQDELFFPYDQGLIFVQAIYEENGWRLVDGMYERPPLSTEHILHPDLYLLYEEPQVVELRALDEATYGDWRLVRSHAIGEFYLREHMEIEIGTPAARTAAAGWGGDHFLLYANDANQTVVVWKLVWDTKDDSDEFNAAYDLFLNNWLDTQPSINQETLTFCWQGLERSVCKLVISGETLIVMAPTLELAQALMTYQLTEPEPTPTPEPTATPTEEATATPEPSPTSEPIATTEPTAEAEE